MTLLMSWSVTGHTLASCCFLKKTFTDDMQACSAGILTKNLYHKKPCSQPVEFVQVRINCMHVNKIVYIIYMHACMVNFCDKHAHAHACMHAVIIIHAATLYIHYNTCMHAAFIYIPSCRRVVRSRVTFSVAFLNPGSWCFTKTIKSCKLFCVLSE